MRMTVAKEETMPDRLIRTRRKYFIKRKFQREFIMKFCALVVLGVIISGFTVYMMSKSTVTTTFENSRLRIKNTAEFILPAVGLASAVVIVLIGLATIAVTLFTSHRIVGPLYRMEQDIRAVASGNLTIRFHTRKTDELKALSESLEDMTGALKGDIERMKSAVAELEGIAGSGAAGEKIKGIKEILDKFVT